MSGFLSSVMITMMNNCGFGHSILTNMTDVMAGGVNSTLAIGSVTYLAMAPLFFNAYFDNGYCGPRGANCSTVSIKVDNDLAVTSMDLTSPYGFSAPFGFSYASSGCATGYWCPNVDCLDGDNPSSVGCTTNGTVALVVLFCPSGPQPTTMSTSWTSVPATSVPENSPSVDSRRIGAIVGGVLGGLAFLTAIALGVFLVFRRRRARPDENREKFEFNTRSESPLDPFRDPPRSSSPAGRSVIGEMPVKVVYS